MNGLLRETQEYNCGLNYDFPYKKALNKHKRKLSCFEYARTICVYNNMHMYVCSFVYFTSAEFRKRVYINFKKGVEFQELRTEIDRVSRSVYTKCVCFCVFLNMCTNIFPSVF